MVYLITYDLNKPGQDYKLLFDAIQKLGATRHIMKSVWLLSTTHTTDTISIHLRKFIDVSDSLIVTQIHCTTSGGLLPQQYWDWLKYHNSR